MSGQPGIISIHSFFVVDPKLFGGLLNIKINHYFRMADLHNKYTHRKEE